jgi:hypothetical protein
VIKALRSSGSCPSSFSVQKLHQNQQQRLRALKRAAQVAVVQASLLLDLVPRPLRQKHLVEAASAGAAASGDAGE